jgi:hypothetical protein
MKVVLLDALLYSRVHPRLPRLHPIHKQPSQTSSLSNVLFFVQEKALSQRFYRDQETTAHIEQSSSEKVSQRRFVLPKRTLCLLQLATCTLV